MTATTRVPAGAADIDAAVRTEALTRTFGEITAVDTLTIAVRRGELFGLVGPDGAGKTTILRMLAGVMRPTAGDAWIDGVSVVHDAERVKQVIAYMPQRFGLYADLTVRENLDFYADLFEVPARDRPARYERLFAFSSLGPFERRLAGKLSGGMKQKLALSCALVHQPGVLLLDEPTFGVDPISRRDLWLIVHEMVAQGVTVVVSTAYMDEAERFDRLALLHKGRVVALDAPQALEAAIAGTMLAVEADRPREARDLLRDHPAVRRATLFGDQLHVTLAEGRDAAVLRDALAGAGLQVHAVDPLEPSLEDVFIARIGSVEDR
ncbi:MAG TPA: ABC transporter ATP-binding protein [Gemmatimonadaceae bacterium]